MKDWYMFICFLIHVVSCPCKFLYMYVFVVSEGLMDD